MDQISEHTLEEAKLKQSSDMKLQQNAIDRQKLPVFNCKAAIMEAINENPVIIIRGNTGCGKFWLTGNCFASISDRCFFKVKPLKYVNLFWKIT